MSQIGDLMAIYHKTDPKPPLGNPQAWQTVGKSVLGLILELMHKCHINKIAPESTKTSSGVWLDFHERQATNVKLWKHRNTQ